MTRSPIDGRLLAGTDGKATSMPSSRRRSGIWCATRASSSSRSGIFADMAEPLALHGGPAVRREFLPFHRPWIDDVAVKEVVDALQSGWITRGPRTAAFEESFRQYVGARHAIALNS